MNRTLKNSAALLAILMLMFAFAGCSDDDGGTGPGTTPVDQFAVVKAAGDAYFATYKIDANNDGTREMGVNITPDGLAAVLSDPSYYIVDWRSATDFAYAHIPGSVNKSIANLVAEMDNLPTDKVIVNACYTGQTASFATSLINLIGTETGHKAINLKFGMSDWAPLNMVKADGTFAYPTDSSMSASLTTTAAVRGAATAMPTFDTAETEAEAILKARAQVAISRFTGGQALVNFDAAYPADTNDTYLVNYFSESAYNMGHLPGAIWYNSAPCEFTSEASLTTLPTDKPVAIYCYTGQTSAQLTAYLSMLGYDAKSVKYGVQNFAFDHAVNTTAWHAATSSYPLEGTGVTSK